MRVSCLVGLLAIIQTATAGPRNAFVRGRRQATSSCSCPSDTLSTATSFATVTSTSFVTVSTNANGIQVTADTQTDTTTIARTTTVQAASPATTTTTIAGTTVITTAEATTITQTITASSTTTTCIVSAYKVKRQASSSDSGLGGSTSSGNWPSSIAFTTTRSSGGRSATCMCKLISTYGFPTTSSTSPATTSSDTCSCSSAPTLTTTTTYTLTNTLITTTTIESTSVTGTFTPQTTATVYSDVTSTTTSTTTVTISQPRITSTTRSTGSATTTYTPTYVSCPTPDATCNNAGVRWGIYRNTNAQGANNTNRDSTYSSFDPTVFKNRLPMYQNVTYTLGGFRYPAAKPVIISFYNSTRTFESDYIAINHVGYIFAQVSGTYTFSISASDDITLFWVGDNAYRGYTRANANIVNAYGQGTSTYRFEMEEKNYYPYRIFFGNAQEAITFQASLTAPDGTVILNSNSRQSPYLVQFTCDNTTAPEFPQFGYET